MPGKLHGSNEQVAVGGRTYQLMTLHSSVCGGFPNEDLALHEIQYSHDRNRFRHGAEGAATSIDRARGGIVRTQAVPSEEGFGRAGSK